MKLSLVSLAGLIANVPLSSAQFPTYTLTVYKTFNSTLGIEGYAAINESVDEFPETCPWFMPPTDVMTEQDPPGIVITGTAPPPDDDLPADIDFFNRQTGRWYLRYNDTEAPQYRFIRYEGLGWGNCTALRNGPKRCCTDYNGVKAEMQLVYDCLWQ